MLDKVKLRTDGNVCILTLEMDAENLKRLLNSYKSDLATQDLKNESKVNEIKGVIALLGKALKSIEKNAALDKVIDLNLG